MGLFNVVGSLQNLESAEAAGDRYETRPSLLANGIGTIAAALFGSAFPTTIYIGHPAWKAMGARAGYSILNGVVITLLCLFGGVTLVLKVVPLEATLGILLWVGIIITAQAFQEVPRKHALAVAFGLIPSLAAWALLLVETSLRKAGKTLFEIAPTFGSDLYIHGVIALNQGFLLSAMVLAADARVCDRAGFSQGGGMDAGCRRVVSARCHSRLRTDGDRSAEQVRSRGGTGVRVDVWVECGVFGGAARSWKKEAVRKDYPHPVLSVEERGTQTRKRLRVRVNVAKITHPIGSFVRIARTSSSTISAICGAAFAISGSDSAA